MFKISRLVAFICHKPEVSTELGCRGKEVPASRPDYQQTVWTILYASFFLFFEKCAKKFVSNDICAVTFPSLRSFFEFFECLPSFSNSSDRECLNFVNLFGCSWVFLSFLTYLVFSILSNFPELFRVFSVRKLFLFFQVFLSFFFKFSDYFGCSPSLSDFF